MSPDTVGVLVGSLTVVALGFVYLFSEGSRRLHAAQERSADRFDVFGDDSPAGHYDGAEWDEPTPLYDQTRDDLDWQAWEAEVSA